MGSACDKLVFEIDGRRMAVDIASVDGVVEVERVFFLPGQKGPVKGIITSRGEAVVVVDMRKVLGITEPGEGKKRVVVVNDRTRVLGLYTGEVDITFIWNEELKRKRLSPALSLEGSAFTYGVMEKDGKPVELLDWHSLWEETKSILSTEEGAGEDTDSR